MVCGATVHGHGNAQDYITCDLIFGVLGSTLVDHSKETNYSLSSTMDSTVANHVLNDHDQRHLLNMSYRNQQVTLI